VPYCLEHTKRAFWPIVPLERGLLTGKIKPGHQFAEGDHRSGYRFFKEQNIVQRPTIYLEKLKASWPMKKKPA
jgi:aryl-alcohol dehydrogenase-like predicted oxidoreductase